MKPFLVALFIAVAVVITAPAGAADPPKEHTYTGEITGVVCVSCKEHIKTVLMKKLDGIVSVDVQPGQKEDGPRKLILVSKSDSMTREQAVKALGSLAKNYEILSLTRQD